jgi:hypothetical protein
MVVAAKYYLIKTGVILMRLAWTSKQTNKKGRSEGCTRNKNKKAATCGLELDEIRRFNI